jgi:unsaturated chondroitin disaccharide hydrolase
MCEVKPKAEAGDNVRSSLPAQVPHDPIIDCYARKILPKCTEEPVAFPHVTDRGKWVTTADGYWTGGFWVGQLWWLWKHTRDSVFRIAAEKHQALLAPRKDAAEVDFDLGFLYAYSFALGYELTGEVAYRQIALTAADRLLTLAHPRNDLIYRVYPQRVQQYGSDVASSIIDVMMNLTLLWWAYEQTGWEPYRRVAERHAHRSADWLVRPNGSTIHVVDFDVQTSELLRHDTVQGYRPDSCWSRGQAWAIYGFMQAYYYTRETAFLKTTHRLLDYWADHLPSDGVPYWDFDAPGGSRHVRDSSAAAIVCAALAQAYCWGITLNETADRLYVQTIASLTERYLTPETADGVLTGGCFHYPADRGVSEATVWGDYYLLEALFGD